MSLNNKKIPLLPPKALELRTRIDALESSLRILLQQNDSESTIEPVSITTLTSMNENIFKLKEEFVKEVHTNTIRPIVVVTRNKPAYCLITRISKEVANGRSDKLQRRVNIPEGMRIPENGEIVPELYKPLYNEMIEALFDLYARIRKPKAYTFEHVFAEAKERWINLINPAHETVRRLDIDYKRYISSELAKKDIRDITCEGLVEYSREIISTQKLTIKSFTNFLGVINKLFDYAMTEELILRDPRPPKDSIYGLKKLCVQEDRRPEKKAFTLEEVDLIRDELWKKIEENDYDYNAYAALFATYTGCRAGEIVALKWDDIDWFEKTIWIHAQLLAEFEDGKTEYRYVPVLKNEKGISRGGRKFPLSDPIREILVKLRDNQEALGIKSDFIFCKEDGGFVTSKGYQSALHKTCKKLGLKLTHNHAFRVSINSYTMIAAGIPVTERAQMLGHSVSTNEHNYSYSDPTVEKNREKLNEFYSKNQTNGLCTTQYNPIPFKPRDRKKSREML